MVSVWDVDVRKVGRVQDSQISKFNGLCVCEHSFTMVAEVAGVHAQALRLAAHRDYLDLTHQRALSTSSAPKVCAKIHGMERPVDGSITAWWPAKKTPAIGRRFKA